MFFPNVHVYVQYQEIHAKHKKNKEPHYLAVQFWLAVQVGKKFYCNYLNGNQDKQIILLYFIIIFSLGESKSLQFHFFFFKYVLLMPNNVFLNVFSFKVAAYIDSKQERTLVLLKYK